MRFLRLLCATVGFMVLGATAFAQFTNINYSMYDQAHTATFNVHYLKAGGPPGGVTEGPAYVGPVNAHVNNTSLHIPDFQVYCVDLVGVVYPGNNYDATVTPFTVGPTTPPGLDATYYSNLQKAAWLYNKYEDDVIDINGTYNTTNGAALQAAIWDVIEGNTDWNVTTGDFYIVTDPNNAFDNAIVSQANTYLANLHAAAPKDKHDGILYLADHRNSVTNGQSMLGGAAHGLTTNSTPSTPEGASLLMFLPGLIPVAVGLRRRRNKAVGK